MPTVPRRDVATVRGRAFDQETGAGLSNVVLKPIEAEPSADQTLKFRVELKIRTMRMLAPLKVKG
ncbi:MULTISPECIES: hypothetical protein [unclassified Thiocapsa]|uniref:hypothetical protein n=1 Tax=unclassified Thiocapsa TaxID=2641286 RepID=UPI0035B25C2C